MPTNPTPPPGEQQERCQHEDKDIALNYAYIGSTFLIIDFKSIECRNCDEQWSLAEIMQALRDTAQADETK